MSTENSKKFFTDDKGFPSSMRLMSFLSLLMAGFLALAITMDWGKNHNTELVLYFLVAAFAPKAVQKFAEKKP